MIGSLLDRLLGRMLSCRQVSDFLALYLDDELDPAVRRRFERHISLCANCAALLNQYRTTVELVRRSGAELPDPPPELVERTLDFLRDQPDLFPPEANGSAPH